MGHKQRLHLASAIANGNSKRLQIDHLQQELSLARRHLTREHELASAWKQLATCHEVLYHAALDELLAARLQIQLLERALNDEKAGVEDAEHA